MTAFIERRSPVSAWGQVMRDIRNKIERGTLAPGEQLLSETDLAEHYEVSRITVRQAMGALASEGYVERRHGTGTFVSHAIQRVQHDLGLETPWRDRLRSSGVEATSEEIDRTAGVAVPGDVLRDLSLDASADFNDTTYLRRVQFVSGQPIGISESWVPTSVAPRLAQLPLVDGSLSKTLDSELELNPLSTRSFLDVAVSNTDEARLLNTHMDVPLFVVLAATFLDGAKVLEVSRTLWLGNRVRFQVARGGPTES